MCTVNLIVLLFPKTIVSFRASEIYTCVHSDILITASCTHTHTHTQKKYTTQIFIFLNYVNLSEIVLCQALDIPDERKRRAGHAAHTGQMRNVC
jgi:hypothetical protein